MIAPEWIQKELGLIDSMYFAVFNPEKTRWQIRKWIGVYPKKFFLWKEFSENILTICREEYTSDRGLQDVGYMDMDRRTIDAIRESHWWKLDYKRKIQELDERNDKREQRSKDQLEYESKYVAKRVWRSMHEPTVHLSGKEWRI